MSIIASCTNKFYNRFIHIWGDEFNENKRNRYGKRTACQKNPYLLDTAYVLEPVTGVFQHDGCSGSR